MRRLTGSQITESIIESTKEGFDRNGTIIGEIQQYLLEMLKDFDQICKDNKIEYWLSGGTCLGAVRHGGFIPWDDDVDVEMTRENFEKLEKVMRNNKSYVLQTNKSDPYYPHTFAKFRDLKTKHIETGGTGVHYKYQGMFIDVIVVENTLKILSKLIFGGVTLQLKLLKTPELSIIRERTFKIVKYFTNIAYKIFSHYPSRLPGNHFGYEYGSPWYRNILSSQDIYPLKKINFEGYLFPCLRNTDSYLRLLYGDYMTPIPPTKITSHTELLEGLPERNE